MAGAMSKFDKFIVGLVSWGIVFIGVWYYFTFEPRPGEEYKLELVLWICIGLGVLFYFFASKASED